MKAFELGEPEIVLLGGQSRECGLEIRDPAGQRRQVLALGFAGEVLDGLEAVDRGLVGFGKALRDSRLRVRAKPF